jgi:hypothetical protein
MTPRHVAKTFVNPHFAPDNYKNSVEADVEKKVELFCNNLKYSFLRKLREKISNGKK